MNYDDIYGIWQPAKNNWLLLVASLLFIVIAIIGVCFYEWYKRYTYSRQPWVLAERELNQLYKKSSGDYKKFYRELIV